MGIRGEALGPWKRFRLSDLVERHVEFSRDPLASGFTRFVKVEHMDPGRLSLSRWGAIEQEELPPTFYNVFRSGHVLFPSRNPHLRRTVWPKFDGICGEKTFVVKSRDALLQDLLPFILQSDEVVAHAVRMKVGSTNPHVRWRDLVSFPLTLPPVRDQRRIARVLLAAETTVDKLSSAVASARLLLLLAAEQLCWDKRFSRSPLAAIASPEWHGFRDGDWIESKDQSQNGIRLLQLADIGIGEFLNKSARFISPETFDRLNCTQVLPGDLLIARMAEPIGRTCIVPTLETACVTAVDCCIARLDTNHQHREYWRFALNTPSWTRSVASQAAGTTRTRISRSNLESIEIAMPAKHSQEAIAGSLLRIEHAATQLGTRLRQAVRIKQSLVQWLMQHRG
jgi:type I restriction enzyme S subunit